MNISWLAYRKIYSIAPFTVTRSFLNAAINFLKRVLERFLKFVCISGRSKQNFVFDFLNKKSTNKFKNFQYTLISRTSPLNFYFFPSCLFCKHTACIQCTLWSLIICRISYLFLNFTFYKSRVEDAGCSSRLVLYITPVKFICGVIFEKSSSICTAVSNILYCKF
jgi:hypothetical protein